jgi:hypothetical protein
MRALSPPRLRWKPTLEVRCDAADDTMQRPCGRGVSLPELAQTALFDMGTDF